MRNRILSFLFMSRPLKQLRPYQLTGKIARAGLFTIVSQQGLANPTLRGQLPKPVNQSVIQWICGQHLFVASYDSCIWSTLHALHRKKGERTENQKRAT